MLYYGCRHEREDYLYREELGRFQRDGVLTQLHVAFSRDQAEKVPPCSPACVPDCPPSVEKDPKGWRFPLAVIGAPSTTAVLCSHVHGLCFPTGCGALLPSPHSCVVSYQIYVQHLLKKNKKNIWKLVHEGNAHIYVCG